MNQSMSSVIRARFAGRARAVIAVAVVALAVVMVAVVGHTSRAHESRAARAEAAAAEASLRPAMTVTTARAERRSLPAQVEASGAVAAWQEASVASRVAGLPLVSVDANVGDVIRKGQVLARFDDADARAALAQSEANLAQAVATARQADANRERALALEKSGALSRQDILLSVTQADSADAQVAQARAALTAARLRLDYTVVTAPDGGVISARSAALGVVAQAGTELFRFIRQGRLEWRAELNSGQLAGVKPGLEVTVNLPDGQTAEGRVRQLAPALSNDTRLVLAYADLVRPGTARAGMYASGVIRTAVRDATTVPSESIVIRDGRTYVLRVNGARAQQVAVEVGRRQGAVAEVISGVAPGDTVVVSGAGFVNDNDVVRVANGAR